MAQTYVIGRVTADLELKTSIHKLVLQYIVIG